MAPEIHIQNIMEASGFLVRRNVQDISHMTIVGKCYKRSLLEEENGRIILTIQFDRHLCAYYYTSEHKTVPSVNKVKV